MCCCISVVAPPQGDIVLASLFGSAHVIYLYSVYAANLQTANMRNLHLLEFVK